MKRVLLIKPLILAIFILLVHNIFLKSNLILNETEITTFISYMKERNNFLGASNFVIWMVIIASLIVTSLNRIEKVKKK